MQGMPIDDTSLLRSADGGGIGATKECRYHGWKRREGKIILITVIIDSCIPASKHLHDVLLSSAKNLVCAG